MSGTDCNTTISINGKRQNHIYAHFAKVAVVLVLVAPPPAECVEFHEPDRGFGSVGSFLLLVVIFVSGGETDVFTSFYNHKIL